jgi:hypothetical protein
MRLELRTPHEVLILAECPQLLSRAIHPDQLSTPDDGRPVRYRTGRRYRVRSRIVVLLKSHLIRDQNRRAGPGPETAANSTTSGRMAS